MITLTPPTNGILRSWLTAKGYPSTLADLHDELNARITDTDFKIGPSYFMRDKIANDPTGAALKLMWRTDILPLLEEHQYGDRNINVNARYGLDALTKSLAAHPVGATAEAETVPASDSDDDYSTAADPR
ncbi:hypothetical protein [Mycolicibacterium wolinskyi]|uniref:hypothetical protein n=1 Tax=Mycolicibacterium wolinskyi TaxID=59750 RepID=UPI00391787A2